MHALSTNHPMSKLTQLAISWKLVNQIFKKRCSGEHIFTPFCQFMAQNSKYKRPKAFVELLFTSGKLALNGPPDGPVVRYSKIQNGLSRAPQDTLMG